MGAGRHSGTLTATLCAALLAAGCRASAPAPEPAEPAPAPAPTTTPAPTPAPQTPPRTPPAPAAPNAAAVRFMQRMIPHHAQALTMAALAAERSERADVKLIAERIVVSQRDEIASMERWLRANGVAVPARDAHAGHGADHASMPGMATQEELEALATSRSFDRRFLDLMIRHHEGALVMVADLLAASGGTRDPAVFTLATDVDADQRAEIARMRALRARLD